MNTIKRRAIRYSWKYIPEGIADVVEQAYIQGAIDQQKIDIEKLKDIMNRLMLDTKDKAEIIKAMES